MKSMGLLCVLAMIAVGCAKGTGDTLPEITPTLYYKPIIEKSKMKCAPNEMTDLVDENDKVLASLCTKDYNHCLLQGSCFYIEDGQTHAFNFVKKLNGISRFLERRENRCPYGYGVKNICQDPFYSVAADPAFHKAGDVIYIPKLVGLALPDGSIHNGYMIVRDEGGAILGENRFDFFTGFYGPFDPRNSFYRIGMSDKRTRLAYQKMPESIAKEVRAYRNYPNIPTTFYDNLGLVAPTVKLFP